MCIQALLQQHLAFNALVYIMLASDERQVCNTKNTASSETHRCEKEVMTSCKWNRGKTLSDIYKYSICQCSMSITDLLQPLAFKIIIRSGQRLKAELCPFKHATLKYLLFFLTLE